MHTVQVGGWITSELGGLGCNLTITNQQNRIVIYLFILIILHGQLFQTQLNTNQQNLEPYNHKSTKSTKSNC
jgi:hypothetical protein